MTFCINPEREIPRWGEAYYKGNLIYQGLITNQIVLSLNCNGLAQHLRIYSQPIPQEALVPMHHPFLTPPPPKVATKPAIKPTLRIVKNDEPIS